jgi:hypothetical protein
MLKVLSRVALIVAVVSLSVHRRVLFLELLASKVPFCTVPAQLHCARAPTGTVLLLSNTATQTSNTDIHACCLLVLVIYILCVCSQRVFVLCVFTVLVFVCVFRVFCVCLGSYTYTHVCMYTHIYIHTVCTGLHLYLYLYIYIYYDIYFLIFRRTYGSGSSRMCGVVTHHAL